MLNLSQICTYFGSFLILCGLYGFLVFHAPTALIASGFGIIFIASNWALQYTATPWVLLLLNVALMYVFTKRVLMFWGDSAKVHSLGYFGIADLVSLIALVLILLNIFKK